MGKLKRTLHHAQWRVAVAVHDAVAERAVVGADTQCSVARFALLDKRPKFLFDAVKFRGILVVRVFADVEFFGVSVVAGVDSNHLAPLHRLECGIRLEMNVGDHRHIRAERTDAGNDRLEVGGVALGLRGDAYDLAAGIDQGH